MNTDKNYMSMSYDEDKQLINIRSNTDKCFIEFYCENSYHYEAEGYGNTYIKRLKILTSIIVEWYLKRYRIGDYGSSIVWQMAMEIANDFIRNRNHYSYLMWDITDPYNIKMINDVFCTDCECYDNCIIHDINNHESEIKEFEHQTADLEDWIERLEDEVFIQDQDDSRITRLEKELFPNEELSLYSQVKGIKTQLRQMTETYENQDKHIARLNNETFIQNRIIDNQNKRITNLEEEIEKLTKIINILANQVQITILR